MQTGTLFYIVGPSGAGKDTLIAGAMEQLAGTGRYVKTRRLITRPESVGEDHIPVDPDTFERMAQAGAFLHSWEAHGLRYGLPVSILGELKRGRNVLANGSRAAMPDLSGVVDRFVVVEITAPAEVLKDRLMGRGRETETEVDARVARAAQPLQVAGDFAQVMNDTTVPAAVTRLITTLESFAARLYLRRMPISHSGGFLAFLPAECDRVDAAAFRDAGRIDVAAGEASVCAGIALDEGGQLAPHEIGLSVEAFDKLGLAPQTLVSVARTPSPNSRELFRAKIRGQSLSADQYEILFRDIVAGRYPESETAAFLLKTIQTLDDDETIAVARARCRFMPRIDWQAPIVVDKHSLGGIPGSRITLVVVPIVAAFGMLMPKTSSRAITSASGTADVMEAIAKIDLDAAQVQSVVRRTGGCIAWNGKLNHSALDDIVNAFTRPLDLNSNYWSVASILSKKWCAGSTHVVIDMPYGPRAKLKTREDADELGRVFELVGQGLGLTVRALATPGNGAIGRGIGPALELRDVLQVLANDTDAPLDLRDKALMVASHILSFSPQVGSVEKGFEIAETLLVTGAAQARFQAIVQAQGGRRPVAPGLHTFSLRSHHAGRVSTLDGWHIAGIARRAGAPFDKGAGIDLHVRVGAAVAAGVPLYTIHASNASDLKAAMEWAQNDSGIRVEPVAAVRTA